MQSTSQELAPVIALVPIDEFRRFGVVPTYFDAESQRLKLICNTAMEESSRSELASRLPNINIEWHLADDKVFDFMYQRIAGEYPAQAAPQANTTPDTPAEDTHNDSGEIESTSTPDQSAEAASETESHETEQPAGNWEKEKSELEAVIRDAEQPDKSDEPVGVESVADLHETVRQEHAVEETAAAPDKDPEPEHDSILPPGQKTVLFVTTTGHISQHLVFALNAERCEAVTVSSFDQATAELERREVACIFVHENLHGQKQQFVRHVQTTRPEIPVRLYDSDASILLNNTRDCATSDLIRQNLTLFSRLHDSQGSAVADHAAVVAKIADRMAARLAIPSHYRPMIATAAFLHNMAEENLKSTEGLQPTDIIGHSASRLDSWGFPLPVVRLLRGMYHPPDGARQTSDDVEFIGGNILTTADAFCHLWPDCSAAAYQADLVRTKLEDRLQGNTVSSVVDALIEIVRDDSAARVLRPNTFSVHIYEAGGTKPNELSGALEAADFGVSFSSTITECVQGCGDNNSNVLIIRESGSVQDVYDTMMALALHGLALDQVQIILLLNDDVVTDALRLLSHGVEDILPATAPSRAVVTKLARLRSRLEEQFRHRVSLTERLGTHGSLGDMCLADLLETFRGNRKPTRISVTAQGDQLTVYLDKGRIVAAECGDIDGMAALLKGISWRQGVWNIDSIDHSELPRPNIDQSIDTALIEACTKLDEAVKDDPVYDLVP